jgi:hypothetical protein
VVQLIVYGFVLLYFVYYELKYNVLFNPMLLEFITLWSNKNKNKNIVLSIVVKGGSCERSIYNI